MISLHALGSAGDAASYYARDNYYTAAASAETSAWAGKGAELLGLAGPVAEDTFKDVLEGRLPDGSVIGAKNGTRRPGLDMTFSAPKSVSLLALVGGDTRIVDAMREATRATLRFAERELAEARGWTGARQEAQRTGNLLAATFLHDVNRLGEPQLHIHAVLVNATRDGQGQWRALHNDPLYRQQHLIGTVHNTLLRQGLEALGYRTVPAANPVDGAFEIAGVPREAIQAFSRRSSAIAAYLKDHGLTGSPRDREIAALATRGPKEPEREPGTRAAQWQALAKENGLDLPRLIEEAIARAGKGETVWTRAMGTLQTAREKGGALIARMGLSPKDGDPLVPERAGRLAPVAYAAAQAVASAVRDLGQREAAFGRLELLRAALARAGPATPADIAARIAHLEARGLLQGDGDRLLTTAMAVRSEQAVLALMREGRGQGTPLMSEANARLRAQDAARELGLKRLNPHQERAASLILASADRVVAVQGVSGAGKSAVLAPVAAIARVEGRAVLGLAVAGTIAAKLREDTGAPAETLARFLARHTNVRDGTAGPTQLAKARAELGGALILLDEASQVGTAQMAELLHTAKALGVHSVALIGDKRQLGAVDAGKPFAQGQASLATATLPESLRARSSLMKTVAAALNKGDVRAAFAALRPHTREAPREAIAGEAVRLWARLPAATRDETLLIASGRRMRADANAAAQAALREQGVLTGPAFALTVLERVSLTREEARSARHYAPGRVVELRTDLPSQKLDRGTTGVVEQERHGKVALRLPDGTLRSLVPARLAPNLKADAVTLYEERTLAIHEGERIRWTANDVGRGLLNGGQARVEAIDAKGVTVSCGATGEVHALPHGDSMLHRLDLAYALNAHAAQGVTSENGILMLSAGERRLATEQAFLVAATRIADSATLVTDDAAALERQVARNPGEKTAALEVLGEGRASAMRSSSDLTQWLGPSGTGTCIPDLPFPEKDKSLEL